LNGIEAARDFASRNGWLSHTPQGFRQAVLERVILKRYEAGEMIYAIGDLPGGLYCALTGSLRLTIAPNQDGPYLAHVLRPGIWFGEGPVVMGRPLLLGLSATLSADVLQLPMSALKDILRLDPSAWRWIAGLAVGNFETALSAMSDLMMRDHVKRFIASLLRLGGCRIVTPKNSGAIEVDISQVDLAVMANVARSTANSILGDLDAKGFVRRTYRRIDIVAPDQLRAMLVE
jgi:CRP/FNR family transcriptional regulator, cyclic AMP receptor protein